MMKVLNCELMHSLAVMGYLSITLSRVHIVLTLRTSRSARRRTDLILIVHPEKLTDFFNSCSKHLLRHVFVTVNWRCLSFRKQISKCYTSEKGEEITQTETSSTPIREYKQLKVYSFG